MGEIQDEARSNMFEQPTFEEYFDKEARGQHYLDNDFGIDKEQQAENEEFDRILEDEQDEGMYRRELLARMFGGQLTARQFGVLMRTHSEEDERDSIKKMIEYKAKAKAGDNIRNMEEMMESFRRRLMMEKNCSEEESHLLVQDHMDKFYENTPSKSQYDIQRRDSRKLLND